MWRQTQNCFCTVNQKTAPGPHAARHNWQRRVQPRGDRKRRPLAVDVGVFVLVLSDKIKLSVFGPVGVLSESTKLFGFVARKF